LNVPFNTSVLAAFPYPADVKLLRIASSALSGSLADALLAQFTGVQLLDLSENRLTGTIPTVIAALSSLKSLSLEANFFNGDVPSLGALNSLQYARLTIANDTNRVCCGARPPQVQFYTCSSVMPSACNVTQVPLPTDQLKHMRDNVDSIQTRSLKLREFLLLLKEYLDRDLPATSTAASGTDAKNKTNKTADAGTPASKARRVSTIRILARLLRNGKVVAFELPDGTIEDVKTVQYEEETGEIVGYELEDGTFVAAPDADQAESKEKPPLRKSEILIIALVSAGVGLALCVGVAFMIFHFGKGKRSADVDDDAGAAEHADVQLAGTDDSLALGGSSGDIELRPPTKRARKVIPGVTAINLPGTNGADSLDLLRAHNSNEALLATSKLSTLSNESMPPHTYTAAPAYFGSADDFAGAPKNSSNDALPVREFMQMDERTPPLHYGGEQQSSNMASPETNIDADCEPERASSSSSNEPVHAALSPLPMQPLSIAQSPDQRGARHGAKRRERTSPRQHKDDNRDAEHGNGLVADFSNIALPKELEKKKKKQPAHLVKHENPVPAYDNVVLPAEMRGRRTVIVEN
jgi:hypothetical protein